MDREYIIARARVQRAREGGRRETSSQTRVVATDRASHQATQVGIVTVTSSARVPKSPAVVLSRVDATNLALTWNHIQTHRLGQRVAIARALRENV